MEDLHLIKTLNILHLEDSQQDAELTARVLKSAGIGANIQLVDEQDDYRKALTEGHFDVVLADHSLFQFNSSEALKIFKSFDLQIPFILVTGTVSEEFAVSILNEGANDYILKSNLARLPSAIVNSLNNYRVKKEREEYLDKIIANEKMLRQAEELAHFGSWEVDVLTGKNKWSPETFRIYGYTPHELEPVIETFLAHVHPEDLPAVQRSLQVVVGENEVFKDQYRIIDKNHVTKYIHSRCIMEYDSKGTLIKIRGINQDVTEQKLAEEKLVANLNELSKLENQLVQYQLKEQKLITEVTIKAQEKERNELAKELHDNINQMLASVKILLNAARECEPERDELITRSQTILNGAIEEIRKLSRSLSAPALGEVDIFEAIRKLVIDMDLNRLFNVHLYLDKTETAKLDSCMELMLYRVVQEQINNIVKHAQAKSILLTLKVTDDRVFMSVKDDGKGFDTKEKVRGIGLKNMKSRVEFYSGKLEVVSSPGNGCEMKMIIPLG